MSRREWKILIKTILKAIEKIENYTKDEDYEKFLENELIEDAVVRNIEIIGEASLRMPEEIKELSQNIPWTKLKGINNRIVHNYFGVDHDIIWQIVSVELSVLKEDLNQVLNSN